MPENLFAEARDLYRSHAAKEEIIDRLRALSGGDGKALRTAAGLVSSLAPEDDFILWALIWSATPPLPALPVELAARVARLKVERSDKDKLKQYLVALDQSVSDEEALATIHELADEDTRVLRGLKETLADRHYRWDGSARDEDRTTFWRYDRVHRLLDAAITGNPVAIPSQAQQAVFDLQISAESATRHAGLLSETTADDEHLVGLLRARYESEILRHASEWLRASMEHKRTEETAQRSVLLLEQAASSR
jgi:hypothetical protein